MCCGSLRAIATRMTSCISWSNVRSRWRVARPPDAPCSKAGLFTFLTSRPTRITPTSTSGWVGSARCRRSDAARGHPDRRTRADPRGDATVHREADRAGHHLRRSSRDRNRERAAVRRNPGQEPPAANGEREQVAVRLQHEPRAAHAAQRHHRAHRDDGHQRGALRHGKGAGAAAAREPRRNSPAWPHQSGARPVEDRSGQT